MNRIKNLFANRFVMLTKEASRFFNSKIFFVCSVLLLLLTLSSNAQVVTTLAGSAYLTGSTDGTGSAARFNSPHGIACDKLGNIYVADRFNHKIRKVTTAGVVTTLAGSGTVGSFDGTGSAASFNEPWGVACDTSGNVYVADTKNYKIRKITSTGVVTTVAGAGVFGTTNGPANIARFGFSSGICVTPDGNTIYVADHNTHVIRMINGGNVSTLAGTIYIAGSDDGPGNLATFNHPYGIDLDNNGNIVVADEWNNTIRRVTPSGNVTTLAGVGLNGSADGQTSAAMFNYPWDITVDNNGNIFIADGFNYNIRKITVATWMVSTYAGTAGVQGANDGTGAAASFDGATGIAYNSFDNSFYVADAYNYLIRKIAQVSSVTINLTASSSTVCFGDSIVLQASPLNLNNYIFKEGATTAGSSTNGVVTIAPLSQGVHNITCIATDNSGATAFSNTLTITVSPQFTPTVSPSGNISFCNGDSVMLTAQNGTAYLWSGGNTTQSIYVNSGSAISVTVTNTNGCKGTSNTITPTVMQGPAANITAGGSLTICANDSVQLNASNGSSWLWSNGATSQNIYSNAQGNYTVTITGANGCKTVSSPVTINYFAGSQASVTPAGPVTIIQGNTISLNASTGSTYQWSNGLTTQAIVVNASGNYLVTVTNSNGCVSQSNVVQVNLISAQQMINALGTTSFCDGYSVMLNSYFSQGNQWYFNGQVLNGETNQHLTATDSGYYSIAVFQNGSWLYSDSILVQVFTSPQMPVVSDTSICSGNSVLLKGQTLDGANMQWFDQDTSGNLLGSGNAFITPSLNQQTIYYVQATSSNGCTSIDRSALTVYVNQSPLAAFNYSLQSQSGSFTVSFNNTTQFGDTYNWIFGDSSSATNTSSQINPSHIFNTSGSYNVILIATNVSGCLDTISQKIIVNNNKDLFIPTTFTPNNDGMNDVFRVRGNNFQVNELNIYDQWGTLIYQTDTSKPTWDGTSNGEHVQNGTYVYRIYLTIKNNEEQVLTGAITVIK